MRCPMCHSARTRVYQTRTHDWHIDRVRQCRRCMHKFDTIEGGPGDPGLPRALSPEDKRTVRRVFSQILTVLGISSEK